MVASIAQRLAGTPIAKRVTQIALNGPRSVSTRRGLQRAASALPVNLVILAVGRPLPVYPAKRTLSVSVGMSQRCQ